MNLRLIPLLAAAYIPVANADYMVHSYLGIWTSPMQFVNGPTSIAEFDIFSNVFFFGGEFYGSQVHASTSADLATGALGTRMLIGTPGLPGLDSGTAVGFGDTIRFPDLQQAIEVTFTLTIDPSFSPFSGNAANSITVQICESPSSSTLCSTSVTETYDSTDSFPATLSLTTSIDPVLDARSFRAFVNSYGFVTEYGNSMVDFTDAIYLSIDAPRPFDSDSGVLLMLPPADTDDDGVRDSSDNCTRVVNVDQLDSDTDGIGNVCDGDFDQNCSVNFSDLGIMKEDFFQIGMLATDMNGDGQTSFADLGLLKAAFFQLPGPSGIPNLCGLP